MIFSELYSAYYNAVAAILSRIIDGEHSEKELQKIVAERAFGESLLTIMMSGPSQTTFEFSSQLNLCFLILVGGYRSWADRSGAETAQRPVDVGPGPTEAKRRP